jgi:hypothetical protein
VISGRIFVESKSFNEEPKVIKYDGYTKGIYTKDA